MLTQRKALVLVTLVLIGCALLNTRWTGWLASPITQTVNTLQYPADFLASALKNDPAVDYPERSEEEAEDMLAKAQAQNNKLWEENRRLNDQLATFQAIYDEAKDVEAIQFVEARVGRYNNDPINPTMLVMRGALHGLKPDDAVAFKANLIGFVSDSIGPANATVALITRKGFSIGVQIKPPPDPDDPEEKNLPPGWPYRTRVTSDGKGAFVCDLKKSVAGGLRAGDYVRAADTILDSADGTLLGLIESIEPSPDNPHNLSRVIIRPRTPIGPQRTVTILTERTD